MNSFKAPTRLAVAAVSALALLTACSGTGTDTSPTPTEVAVTTAESTPKETVEPTPEETMPTEETTPDAEPSEMPETPEAGPTPPPTGPLEGDALNAAGVAWFGAYCTGVKKALTHAGPDTTGMTVDQAKDTAVEAYANLGEALSKASTDLSALDATMNFEGAPEFAAHVADTLNKVGLVYSAGSDTFEAGTFSSEQDMVDLVDQIEAEAVAAGSDGFGVKSLDATVQQAVGTDVPECAG